MVMEWHEREPRVLQGRRWTQTEMDKWGGMRKAEARLRSRRSGRRPELEGPWEGASEREKVVVVGKAELSYKQMRMRERRMRSEKRTQSVRRSGAQRMEAGRKRGREAAAAAASAAAAIPA